MTFLKSIKTCLIDKPFTFSGRASRSEYWWFVLFYVLIGFLLPLDRVNDLIPRLIPFAIILFLMIILSSVTCRRLHDMNRSGWWSVLNYIVFYSPVLVIDDLLDEDLPQNVFWIPDQVITVLFVLWVFSQPAWFLWMTIKKGTPGPNRFGEDPLQQPQFMNTET